MAEDKRNFGPNTEENETFIIETAMACSRAVAQLKASGITQKSRLFETARKFDATFVKLFEAATGERHSGQTSSKIPTLKNFRNNRYAYFKEVYGLLNEHAETNQESMKLLNESIVTLGGDNKYDFEEFKIELQDCIKELESVDDFKKLDTCMPEVQRIKILARKPMYVYGFDVINSPVLRSELKETIGVNMEDAYAILWDRTNKQLLFPFKSRLIAYDIVRNRLGDFNELNADVIVDPFTGETLKVPSVMRMDLKNYMDIIGTENNRNIVTIWTNIPALDIKFTDNLFGDEARKRWLAENPRHSDKNHIVK
jgi:hypothetical protein